MKAILLTVLAALIAATLPILAAQSALPQKNTGAAPAKMAPPGKQPVPGHEIFDRPTLLDIKLTVTPQAEASLRKSPREWIEAAVEVDGRSFPKVAVHLKGSTSFMPLDKKPSLTLSFNKYESGRRLYGLRKIHLNNSVQNPGYLNDDLTSELFRRAGVPAARSAWAKVQLNGRNLGLYVLKEGFTSEFLALHFSTTKGNLYDGGLHHEIDEPLVLVSGDGPKDHADLKALHAAAINPNINARWQELQRTLDVDRFISMMAMESLTAHIDGYSLMQNNYLIYFDPETKRAVFLVHGLDRMFEQANYPVEPRMIALVSKAVLSTPEGAKRYRQRLAELSEKVFLPEWMSNRMETAIQLLKPFEPLVEPEANAVRQLILERVKIVRKYLAENPAKTPL